jgi:hypothetical protein
MAKDAPEVAEYIRAVVTKEEAQGAMMWIDKQIEYVLGLDSGSGDAVIMKTLRALAEAASK